MSSQKTLKNSNYSSLEYCQVPPDNIDQFYKQTLFISRQISEQYHRSLYTVFWAIFNWYVSFYTKTDQEELEDEMMKKIVQKVVEANSRGVTEEMSKNWIIPEFLFFKNILCHKIHFYQEFQGFVEFSKLSDVPLRK